MDWTWTEQFRTRQWALIGGGAALVLIIILGIRMFTGGPGNSDTPPEVQEVIELEKDKNVPELVKRVQSPNEAAARRALVAIRNSAPPEQAAPHIQVALADPRPAVREQAALQFGQLGGGQAVQPFVAAVRERVTKDDSAAVRASAAQALAWMDSPEAIDTLLRGLQDKDVTVRRASKAALEEMNRMVFTFDPDAPPDKRQAQLASILPMGPRMKQAYALWLKRKKSGG